MGGGSPALSAMLLSSPRASFACQPLNALFPIPEAYKHKLHFRELQLTDGRPITIHRHAVKFFCPPKDSPADSTIAGIKSAEKAIPLKVAYAEFRAWLSA